jgi:hypothetical protein
MPTSRQRCVEWFYFVALLVGTTVPLSVFVPWLLDNGLDVELFVRTLFGTPVSSYFGWDVIITVLVLWSMCAVDDELPTRERTVIALCSFLGASVGVPAFLWLRARHRRRARSLPTTARTRSFSAAQVDCRTGDTCANPTAGSSSPE